MLRRAICLLLAYSLTACAHTAQETALTVKDVVEAVISEMWLW